MSFFLSQVARPLRFLSTRLLEYGFLSKSLYIEKKIFKIRGDEVALRRILNYGSKDIFELLKEAIEERGVESIDSIVYGFISKKNNFISDSVLFSPVSEEDIEIDLVYELNSKVKKIFGIDSSSPSHVKAINQVAFFLFKDKRPDLAIKYGVAAYKYKRSEVMSRYVANAYFRSGDITSAVKWFGLHPEFNKQQLSQYSSLKALLDNGFTNYPEVTDPSIQYRGEDNNRSVVYLLHNSLPYFSGGYATRSNGVIGGIKSNGWDISAISRLGFPNDTKKGPAKNKVEKIDGIRYSLLIDDDFDVYKTPLNDYLIAYGEALYQSLKSNPPKIIHAASFFMNGIAAVYAARKLGCKVVYEVRGLNELSKMSDQPHWAGSEHYRMMVKMETQAALGADKVFTLTQALKDEFVSRGVVADKIAVLPNGVHSSRFSPMKPSGKLAKKLCLSGEVVIGFVGSFVEYEGLDLLMKAVASIKGRTKVSFKVLMVGDGTCHSDIVELSKRLKLSKIVQFTGRVPHHEVEEYYSLIDICPFPRKGLPVCEMVSPLKPFEAMAMEKAVLSSNVNALSEIVSDGNTGLLFDKDNVESLAEKLTLLIDDQNLRYQLGVAAREWVIKERDWDSIGKRVDSVYKGLLK